MPKPLVVDSSVLIALNSQEGKLETRLRQRKNEGYAAVMPEAIMKEVIDEPNKFAEEVRARSPVLADKVMASALRISTAVEQGLIKVETVNYKKYSKVMDNVRKHLSRLDVKSEHAVKKGDAELIALVIQFYDEAKEKIFVATLDKGLLKALKPFSDEVEYEIRKAMNIRTSELCAKMQLPKIAKLIKLVGCGSRQRFTCFGESLRGAKQFFRR